MKNALLRVLALMTVYPWVLSGLWVTDVQSAKGAPMMALLGFTFTIIVNGTATLLLDHVSALIASFLTGWPTDRW